MHDGHSFLGTFEFFLFAFSSLLLLSILASRTLGKAGIPALIVFLGLGVLSRDIFGFDSFWIAQKIGISALLLILFSGGLDTEIEKIRPILFDGILLSTIGVVITGAVVAFCGIYWLNIQPLQACLLGAIVSSTDAAAVFSVLRGSSVRLPRKLKYLFEFESGINDPMAILLTLMVLGFIVRPPESLGRDIFIQTLWMISSLIVGGVVGVIAGRLLAVGVNKLKLDYSGLYPVFTLGSVSLVYAVSHFLKGNGFLAVYIAGVYLGNQSFVYKRTIMQFHDGLSWLMQIAMFLILGLLAQTEELVRVAPIGILVSLILIFIARPLAVFVSLGFRKNTVRELLMISWTGLRGSVPIILATYPMVANVDGAQKVFHIVFFVVVSSVLIQGSLLAPIAKWLDLSRTLLPENDPTMSFLSTEYLKKEIRQVTLPEAAAFVGKRIVEVGLPQDFFVVLIRRAGEFVVPRGDTQLFARDELYVLSDDVALKKFYVKLEG